MFVFNTHLKYESMRETEIEISWFTGLKDKNGKEIYEKDVVSDGTNKWLVERSDGGFILLAHDLINQKYAKTLDIIGNIHESPELYEVQNEYF